MIFKTKAFHVNSDAHFGHHFYSDFQGILEGSQKFCPDF